jgi:Flp pilus assembly secretin CpaC
MKAARVTSDEIKSGLFERILMLGFIAVLSGCGDFFAKKPTEIESMEILNELSQVRESPKSADLPHAYLQPPSCLAIKDGVKLFYFTRHHPAGELAALVEQQMGIPSTVNSATNQIVAYCKDQPQADAVQQYLELIDVTPVQINVDCLILERFGDVTMDWETTLLVENLLGEQITLGETKYPNPEFPGASLREAERANFGLDFGYWHNQGIEGHQVRAVVDVLVSRGYLKILLNPQLETVNGQQATVTIKDYSPIEEVKTGAAGASSVYNITKYVWVENTLTVTPYAYSDGSIGLKTDIKIGSRSKPEGVVQAPIITERSINVEENRIEPGKSLIIGGMRKSERRSVVRGIPFFKDLPLLGILFSSKDFEEKGTEIIFILTPSISSGGQENSKMVQDIRKKYRAPEYQKGLTDVVTGPFTDTYTQIAEKKATEAEMGRVQAEVDLEQTLRQAEAEKERADRAETQALELREKAIQLQQQAAQIQAEADAQTAQAQTTKTEIQTNMQKVQELEIQRQQLGTQIQQALHEAEQYRKEAEDARQKAAQAEEQARQAQERLAAEVAAAAAETQQPAPEPQPAPEAQPEPEVKTEEPVPSVPAQPPS